MASRPAPEQPRVVAADAAGSARFGNAKANAAGNTDHATTPDAAMAPSSSSSSSPPFSSPSSASAISSSPSSTVFLSMAGTAALTPLSSLDGGEIHSPSSIVGSIVGSNVADGTGGTDSAEAYTSPCIILGKPTQRPERAEAEASVGTTTTGVIVQSPQSAQATSAPERRRQDPSPLVNTRCENNPSNRILTGNADKPSTLRVNTGSLASDPASAFSAVSDLPRTSALSGENLLSRTAARRSPTHALINVGKSRSTDQDGNADGVTVTSPTTIVRPKFTNAAAPLKPAIVRTTSSHGRLPLRQPVPDPKVRTGIFAGNIAQLEATAEQLSMTSSIEDAIREAHQELKRSDSRRSSILAASLRHSSAPSVSDSDSIHSCGTSSIPRQPLSRNPSFVWPTRARATGDYRRFQNRMAANDGAGNASGTDAGPPTPTESRSSSFLQRHGSGKSSVRSIPPPVPAHGGLPEIAETEPPVTLTQDALDEADRLMASGEDHADDDTIRASAHQDVDADFDTGVDTEPGTDVTSGSEAWTMLGFPGIEIPPPASPSVPAPSDDLASYGGPGAYVPNPIAHQPYQPPSEVEGIRHDLGVGSSRPTYEPDMRRPTTSGSGGTFEQAEAAFGDFDGVHCDPDAMSDRFSEVIPPDAAESEANRHTPTYRPRPPPAPRPTSYLDPETGQSMLYYPARVPAMLQLPPKLSKNPKGNLRNKRRSQVVSMMAQGSQPPAGQPSGSGQRQSRGWLPDPLAGDLGSPLMDTKDLSGDASSPIQPYSAEALLGDSSSHPLSPTGDALQPSSQDNTTGAAPDTEEPLANGQGAPVGLRGPNRLRDPDKRKSRLTALGNIPPQLRASAFFDMPATTPNVQVKNGSATDTLDSILDASASAPVSAFTDHAFAGKLGAETYGAEKKRNKRNTVMSVSAIGAPSEAAKSRRSVYGQTSGPAASKSRSSFMSLVGHIRKVSEPVGGADDRRSLMSDDELHRSAMADGEVRPGEAHASGGLAPGEDERLSGEEETNDNEDDDSEDDEDSNVYEGAPTTLLAELQLRKQQQRMRTQPVHKTFPNGMHSTLLELDAVAEVERKARKDKRVNLAWEDPAMNPDDEEDDDEDVPLGLLYAAKVAGHNDVSAAAAEMSRPLGLMEKKELEDNEPLSRRRDRLQGRNPTVSMYFGNGVSDALKRQSMLTLTPNLARIPPSESQRSVAGADGAEEKNAEQDHSSEGVEEVEDEPLTSRLKRMKAKEESQLPRARPVSRAFSAELLSQFGDPEEEPKSVDKDKDKGKKISLVASREEETLGQRRRRLQAEREAREQEMQRSGILAVNGPALDALNGANRMSRRLSMADMLSAHPLESARGMQDPRQVERLRLENEAAQAARGQQKLLAMRSQMAPLVSDAAYGSGMAKTGGFMGGRYNDGTAGILGSSSGPGVGAWAGTGGMTHSVGPMGPMGPMGSMGSMGSMGYTGRMSGMGAAGVGAGGFGQNTLGMGNAMGLGHAYTLPPQQTAGMNNGYGGYPGFSMPMAMQQPMPMQFAVPPQGQIDRVERWRQSVQP